MKGADYQGMGDAPLGDQILYVRERALKHLDFFTLFRGYVGNLFYAPGQKAMTAIG